MKSRVSSVCSISWLVFDGRKKDFPGRKEL